MTLSGSVASKANGLTGDVYGSLVRQTMGMHDFLGAMPQNVDNLCRLLYVHGEVNKDGLPDWLRGCDRVWKLPRYNPTCDGTCFELSELSLSTDATVERLIWIVENQHGAWRVIGNPSVRSLILARDEDAVHYRLRWS